MPLLRPTPHPGACAIATLVALLVATAAGAAEPLYEWTDASGNVRYTSHLEQIPLPQRISAVVVEPGRSAAENAALLPGARAAESAEPARDASPAAPEPTPAVDAGGDAELDARIAELEATIERDQTALKELVSDPEAAAGLRESDALAAIAQRLPRLQEELRELRARRDARSGTDGH